MRGIKSFRQSRRYIHLDDDTGFTDAQFERRSTPGALGIIFGSLITAGIIADDSWLDKGKPFLFLGSLLFIPGAYHVRLAYYAYKEYEGYDFNQIPDWD
ncbi:9556_t:CDS:2 [Ambispora gerdemannii]|uniref:Transmembrane protein 230 n=1 Tax=Ambispora gerdemannii TaxID=144530 RepID=A0A9N8Z966_9GLOM|nr:9556_t:CDS:2 [Ambispora gerdemannii]